MRRERTALVALCLAGVVALVGACARPGPATLPPSAAVLAVQMQDYRFDHDAVVPPGRTVFRIRNTGHEEHALTLARIPDELELSIGELFADEIRRSFPMTAQVRPRAPGASGTFAVDLRPGRYALVCFLAGADGEPHFRKGMFSELRVS